ncbi:MAG: glycerate kinase, partial [Elusimicrobiota bacterium]|nr:glycerate kinase [Elusimicrobiota bacterium]
MKILIAPNAFKGTLTARAAGAAAARAVRRVCPGAAVEVVPIADGGDGLLEALRPALGGKIMRSRVEGPLGEKLTARWLMAGRTAVIEMAEASGLGRLGKSRLRPLDASTRGVGQLMAEAVFKGALEIIVGLGGSASNDGGAGCAQAFGFSLLDAGGRPIACGARGLAELATISAGLAPHFFRGGQNSGPAPHFFRGGQNSGPAPHFGPGTGKSAGLKGVRVTGLADVRNPLCGRLGSARVFGPQKGAGPREVEFIGKALLNYARVVKKCLSLDIAGLRGGAAAGGLGAGLAAFFGAELADGAAFVLEKAGFEKKLARADLLITGEGCFDRQTFYGKAPGAAIAAARRLGKPAVVVCGRSLIKDRRALARLGVAGVIEAGAVPDPAGALRLAVERALPSLLSKLAI